MQYCITSSNLDVMQWWLKRRRWCVLNADKNSFLFAL